MVPQGAERTQERGPPSPAPVPENLREFGQYLLLEELGRGAQGVVYLAEDTVLHRKVALKLLLGVHALTPAVRERFQREAEVASRLDHPGICGIHEVGEIQGIPYIAMRYLRGVTLAQMIEQARGGGDRGERADPGASSTSLTGKDALQDVLRLVEAAARALHVAHEAGLVHRDVKPANVMVTPEGGPVLLDFGLARAVEDQGLTLTETGQVLGTPAYLAAEQLRGIRDQIDRRTDVYALGVTLYECLTLRRPFEAQSFEQLFHLILQGTPAPSRKLNPRIPRDLATIVKVAMERDRGRRYSSALDLAEDLRRVRSFEPIRARAAGPLTRLRKWSRRRPAAAVGLAGTALFGLSAAGLLAGQDLARRRASSEHLERAAELFAAGDHASALVAVAQSRELAPDSVRAVELEARIEAGRERAEREALRSGDLAAAAAAREESAKKQRAYAGIRERIAALEADLERQRPAVRGAYAPSQQREAFARLEEDLESRRRQAERTLQEARESLELAARYEARWGPTPATEAAFASYYLGRWREAAAAGDATGMDIFRSMVEQHDPEGEHARELLGRGRLTLGALPVDAELHLFRYEPYETVRPDGPVPRLVPVPTAGVGRSRPGQWVEGFHPGDPCLVIAEVEPGSPAGEAGLRPGDLVVRVNGQAPEGLFLAGVVAPAAIAEARLSPGARIESLNGAPIERPLDWALVPSPGVGVDRVAFAGVDGEIACDRDSLEVVAPEDLVARGCEGQPLRLTVLRDGEPESLSVEAGRASGLRCDPTAYPLILSPENRLPAGTALDVDPGSYLLLARREGFEDLRQCFVVPRLGTVEVRVSLGARGSSPPGFVRVPAGRFVSGGDPEAREPAPAREAGLPEFFIARREVTNGEWFEFVRDPQTQLRIAASTQPVYVPREPRGGPIPEQNLGGPETPVMGVSWTDARDYLAWRNARAEAAGEPWVYDLPTELEWEKAARGADGRAFPWGSRFDFDLVVGLHRRPSHLFAAPGGYEPRDESPYGVQDLGGHRKEWTSDRYPSADPGAPPIYRWRGGCWRDSLEWDFRAASRGYGEQGYTGGNVGLRLVARPRD